MSHVRKDVVVDSLRSKLEEACKTAASEAVTVESERSLEVSKRLRREITRKDEMLKAHDGRADSLREALATSAEAAGPGRHRLHVVDRRQHFRPSNIDLHGTP